MGCTVSCVVFASRLDEQTLARTASAFDWANRDNAFVLLVVSDSVVPGATVSAVSLWSEVDAAPWDDFARGLVQVVGGPALALTVSDHGQAATWQEITAAGSGRSRGALGEGYLDVGPDGFEQVLGVHVPEAKRLMLAEALTIDAARGLCVHTTSPQIEPGWISRASVQSIVDCDVEGADIECCLLSHQT